MLPKIHIIIGAIVSSLIFLFFPSIGWLAAIIIFLSSFLIDFDHYLFYVFKSKDINPRKAFLWFLSQRDFLLSIPKNKRKDYKKAIFIFHGIEFLVVLTFLVVFVHKIFLFILLGIIIHLAMDLIDILSNGLPLYQKTSQIYTHIKNKGKKEIK